MSGLPRFMICPASGALPQVGHKSEAGDRGTEIHALIEGALVGDVGCLDECAARSIELEKVAAWFPGGGAEPLMVEPKVAYDVEGRLGRRINLQGARNYGGLLESEIAGSADLALWHEGTLYLADIKTGYHVDAIAGAAAGNWQLRGLALGLWWARPDDMPAGCCRAALMKVREDGRVDIDEVSWGPGDLAGFAEELAIAWRRRRPEAAVTSPWCAYCPSLLACPATRQTVELLGPRDALLQQVAELPPVRAAEALAAWRHLKRIGEAVEERAKHLAREGLLPGWRLVERERRELHGGVAFHVLEERHGRDVAREAVELATSQTQIRDVLRGVAQRAKEAGEMAPRGWLGEEMAAVLAEVEGRGGVETKSYEVLLPESSEEG